MKLGSSNQTRSDVGDVGTGILDDAGNADRAAISRRSSSARRFIL